MPSKYYLDCEHCKGWGILTPVHHINTYDKSHCEICKGYGYDLTPDGQEIVRLLLRLRIPIKHHFATTKML